MHCLGVNTYVVKLGRKQKNHKPITKKFISQEAYFISGEIAHSQALKLQVSGIMKKNGIGAGSTGLQKCGQCLILKLSGGNTSIHLHTIL